MQTSNGMGRWVLRLDGAFLFLAGAAAMTSEFVGHFFGKGPLAGLHGSPFTIGGFEAHGLAVLIAVLLLQASAQVDRRMWHAVGLTTHLFLGCANLLFWTSFVQQGVVPVGYVTTALHIVFAVAQALCLRTSNAVRA